VTEQAWWQQHRVLLGEVLSASDSFILWRDINNIGATDPSVLLRLQQNPEFWNTVTHGLQTTFIITIGRIFDRSPRSYSIQKLLSKMTDHPQYFSKSSLEMRKRILANKGGVSWLPDYMNDVWVPSQVDLERLRDNIQPSIEKYEQIYQPIRNKLFAHRDMGLNTQMLLERSRISDIEHIIYTARDTLEAIHQLYVNGREPKLGVQQYNNESLTVETRRLLEGLIMAGSRVSRI